MLPAVDSGARTLTPAQGERKIVEVVEALVLQAS